MWPAAASTPENGEPARHNGIHRFFLEKGARVKYIEKHVGTGQRVRGIKSIDPVTECDLEEGRRFGDGYLPARRGGPHHPYHQSCTWAPSAKLVIRERLLTEADQQARTDFEVTMNGEGSAADLVSRSVATGQFPPGPTAPRSSGNAPCAGHSECDAIIADQRHVWTPAPELSANDGDAALIHEAAIGKIAGEQIMKLRTLGLTEEEAEEKIVEGFLS